MLGIAPRAAGVSPFWFALLFALAGIFPAAAPLGAQPTSFYTVTPCRVVDTRNTSSTNGGPALAPGGSPRIFGFAGRCGISTGAIAVSANVTIVSPSGPGYLTLFPASGTQPLAATITYAPGQVRANNAILTLGADGGIAIAVGQSNGTSAHVVIDVNGYFADEAIDHTKVAPPVISPPPGAYSGAQSLSLATSTASAQIRYTTDGSVPTSTTGTLYSGPFILSSTATVKAIASASGLADSSVTTGVYTIGNQPTLFIAVLTPQGAAQSLGSGAASLLLAADGASAVLRFNYTNLSTPVTGAHIHGPAGQGQSAGILFDIDAATPAADGSYLWTFVPVGTLTVPQIVDTIRNGLSYINIHTSQYPSGEIRGQFLLATGSPVFTPPNPPPNLPPGPADARDAVRFLHQATYGPASLAEISALQSQGFDGWLNQQFALPVTSHLAYLDAARTAGEEISSNQVNESIWKQAVQGNDQLRQRVALALSEFLVVSDASSAFPADGLASYMDILERDAFGNYRQLLEDITLSPTMGAYLNMLGNDKEDPSIGQNPNENYAREILQLFSIGLNKTFPDGTLQLDAYGLPIPTYNQDVVKGFARVFTGWSFGGADTTDPDLFYWPPENWRIPMAVWPSHHSEGAKRLLDGNFTAANGTPQQDLKAALDNIFNHPNVGPFVARLLIQRLVTSNPSPAYVYRVGQVFNNNGQGVRGDMKAVVRAILLDYEARAEAVTGNQGYGHLREPIVRMGHLMRAFHASAPSGKFHIWYLEDPTWGLGQNPLRSPTVFNFFSPTYSLPGAVAQAGLVSPEFQILTETTAISNANMWNWMIYYGYDNDGEVITLDFSPWLATAANPTQLVDSLNLYLMANSMSSGMRTILINTLSDPSLADPGDRVRAAVRLIVTSPEYSVQR